MSILGHLNYNRPIMVQWVQANDAIRCFAAKEDKKHEIGAIALPIIQSLIKRAAEFAKFQARCSAYQDTAEF